VCFDNRNLIVIQCICSISWSNNLLFY